mgnify:FL=1|tara:strand:- start:19070 stop:19687 length:618 start_codon:yes stop_codon:yes gene_type:complete
MRTLIIGDVHGCLRELDLLLEKAGYRFGDDRLIFVGDLINKGPNSLGVLQRAYELKAEVVIGNHEYSLLFKISQGELPIYPREIIDWIKTWPTYIETDQFLVVHGGIIPGVHPGDSEARTLTRIRTWNESTQAHGSKDDPAWFEFYEGKKLVVFGHWAAEGLVWRNNAIGLDTGCVYGRKLSCLVLPGKKLVQVDALKEYAPIIA